MCFDRIDEKIIVEMERLDALVDEAYKTSDPVLTSNMDADFHNVYIELADNVFLKAFNEELSVHARRYRNLHFKDSYMTEASHKDILKALRKGDRKLAIETVRNNWTLKENAAEKFAAKSK